MFRNLFGGSLSPPISNMKILSLNRQGLGIPKAVKELYYLASEEGPKVFYLFIFFLFYYNLKLVWIEMG